MAARVLDHHKRVLLSTERTWAQQRSALTGNQRAQATGQDAAGNLVLMDEILTPDSSRFWEANTWQPGSSPASYDKQYIRDWLETLDWDKTPPGPEVPAEVITGTLSRYREAVSRLAGNCSV